MPGRLTTSELQPRDREILETLTRFVRVLTVAQIARAWWSQMAASYRIASVRAPVLLNLSEDEALRGFRFYAHMRAQERPIEFYIYPEANHVKARPIQLLQAQRRTADWIDFWLKDDVREDPDDPERAQRWRALRESRPPP